MTEKEYQKEIQLLNLKQLQKFWNKKQPRWDVGKVFEYSLIRAFELDGATVSYPYCVSNSAGVIEQIDGAIHLDNLSVLVESKNYGGKALDIEPLAKLQVRLLRRPATVIGCIFSTSGYTWPAQLLVDTLEPKTILLWDKEDIEDCFKDGCFVNVLLEKYRFAVERGDHYYKPLLKKIKN